MQSLNEEIGRIKFLMMEAAAYTYQQLKTLYDNAYNDFYAASSGGEVNYDYNDPAQYIVLSNGRLRGARVPKQLLVDALNAAKRAGLDVYTLLGLIGQESTFGNGNAVQNRSSKTQLVSGWNLRERYAPYSFDRFLADNKVQGVQVIKNNHQWDYQVSDPKAVDAFLATPRGQQLAAQYVKRLQATPKIPANFDDFEQAALWIKQKGIASYNPGMPNYESGVQARIQELKTDRNLVAFLQHPVVPPPTPQTGRQRRGPKRI